ncbi:MAG: M81 family metallopeptidase, partial [Mesorhizobium sp.]
IQVLPTSREPMRSFVDRIKALHGKDGVLSVSVIHGFMAADVPEMGTRILVVTDNDKEKGDALAESLGRELYAMREKTAMTMLNTADGIERALAVRKESPNKPVVIADIWDNPGGGVAGDGTVVLRELLVRGISNVGMATIWDPIAVTFCHAAGEPIDARVKVLKAVGEGWQSFGPSRVTLGSAAVVRIEGTEVDVILNTNRTQTFEPDIFSNIGIDPLSKDILLIKSTNHFYAGFAPIAAEIIYVSAPSSYPSNPAVTDYRKLTRPVWPRVKDPWL